MGWRKQFKGRQFADEVILWAVWWYLMFPISYRDLELMLLDRGVEVDHTTIFRWIQAYAAEIRCFTPRWSCSIRLFKYFDDRSFVSAGSKPSPFSSRTAR